jgi:hypothetical protein
MGQDSGRSKLPSHCCPTPPLHHPHNRPRDACRCRSQRKGRYTTVLRHSADRDAVQTKTNDSMTSPIALRWRTMNRTGLDFPTAITYDVPKSFRCSARSLWEGCHLANMRSGSEVVSIGRAPTPCTPNTRPASTGHTASGVFYGLHGFGASASAHRRWRWIEFLAHFCAQSTGDDSSSSRRGLWPRHA